MTLAVSYLRVSTAAQAETDERDPEGYSIPAQRGACSRKAESLKAEVVEEFVDRGESAKTTDRPALQRLLERIEQRDIEYVIVHKVDRLARNRADDALIGLALKAAGVTLVSCTENIDATPSGRLMHGIMASIAEFYSANLATEILKGMDQKAKTGGTLGPAPTGYLNVRHFVDGREVRAIDTDPVRAPLITYAFNEFATGMYTLRQLLAEVSDMGLTCRATAKYPEAPLSLSKFAKILRNPYYIGVVTYKGVQYEGRHDAIVDPQVFNTVQQVLDGRTNAGVKERTHTHALKGTVYCARCHSRLSLSYSRGRLGGIYPYFFCLGRQRRNGCDLPYMNFDAVEEKVARIWQRVQLNSDDIEELRVRLAEGLRADAEKSAKQRKRLESVINKANRARYMWADKSANGSVPDDIAREKQSEIARTLTKAKADLAAFDVEYIDMVDTLNMALDLAANCERSYQAADESLRRLWNQAFFERMELDEDDSEVATMQPLFQGLHAEARKNRAPRSSEYSRAKRYGRHTKNPDLVIFGRGSSESRMVVLTLQNTNHSPALVETALISLSVSRLRSRA